VRAIDVRTGKAAWDFKLPSPPWAGVMATAGGLVFGGRIGYSEWSQCPRR
jgi:alcohol dehydrogenase (cytochrome c)